jgi:site-specific DNA-methyltransferase (adenine-specific)
MANVFLRPFFAHPNRGIRLYHADAFSLLQTLPEASVDLIFADPPYFLSSGGITCQSGKRATVDKGVWDIATTFEEMHQFNLTWLSYCRRLLKPNGTIWVTGTMHNIYSVGYALQLTGYKILNDIAWYKVNPPPNLSCRYFTHATETILWARCDVKARHCFHYEAMKSDNGGKQMQSLWRIQPPAKHEKRHGKHPTQKPEALLDRILRAASSPNDVILDPFCGSGTTGVVCARLGRQFIGIDQESEYLNIARARLQDEFGPINLVFCFTEPEKSTNWQEAVSDVLQELGGEADLKDIVQTLAKSPRTRKTRTWHSTVRRVVRESKRFEPVGRGRYRLKVC